MAGGHVQICLMHSGHCVHVYTCVDRLLAPAHMRNVKVLRKVLYRHASSSKLAALRVHFAHVSAVARTAFGNRAAESRYVLMLFRHRSGLVPTSSSCAGAQHSRC